MRSLTLLLFFCLSIPGCGQQDGIEKYIGEDPLRAATNLTRYEVADSSVTPAPKGYKPFYISHIGRHGCRTHSTDKRMKAIPVLEQFAADNLLTKDGLDLLKTLQDIRDEVNSAGIGLLTDRGRRTHEGIARRMVNNYPEVFSNPEKPVAVCYSSFVPRVIESMYAFVGQLSRMRPEIKPVQIIAKNNPRASREVFQKKLPKDIDERTKELAYPYCDSTIKMFDCSRLVAKTFVDGKIPDAIKGEEAKFFKDLHLAGCIRQCLDNDRLGWVEPYFTRDELYAFWAYTNTKTSNLWFNTIENEGVRTNATRRIVLSIVDDADRAVSGVDTCATLRFSHDGIIAPMLSLIGLDSCVLDDSFRNANSKVCTSYVMPMGGNFQMIFFRNRSGRVLVKLVHNDKETTIPGLKAAKKGIFYDWKDLRKWMLEKAS